MMVHDEPMGRGAGTTLLLAAACSESEPLPPLPDPCADVPAAHVLVVEETQPASHPLPNDVAVDERYVYWVDFFADKVRRIRKDGSYVETLANDGAPQRVAVDDQSVYWIGGLGDVSSVSKTGGSVTLWSASSGCRIRFPCGEAIAVDTDSVYWIADARLMARAKQNGMPKEVATQGLYTNDLLVDQTHIYWGAVVFDGTFYSAVRASPKSGGPFQTLAMFAEDQAGGGWPMAADALNIYVARSDGIWRVPKDASGPVQVSQGPLSPRGVATDGANVYVTENDRVLRVSTIGGEHAAIACDQQAALRITVDDSSVYWNAEWADAIVETRK